MVWGVGWGRGDGVGGASCGGKQYFGDKKIHQTSLYQYNIIIQAWLVYFSAVLRMIPLGTFT